MPAMPAPPAVPAPPAAPGETLYSYRYPHPAVTVDTVLIAFLQGALQLLLVQRRGEPFRGHWALPGGFVEIDEALEDAAARELAEETGATGVQLEQLQTFGAPDRDPRERVISVVYLALLAQDRVAQLALSAEGNPASDAAAVRWWPLESLPPLAFDHAAIVACARQRLRWKLERLSATCELLPAAFTLSQMQRLCECIQGEPLDKRNFRRRVLEQGLLEETGDQLRGVHRPARLFRFSREALAHEEARRLLP